jgi:uncharacterized membrane protein
MPEGADIADVVTPIEPGSFRLRSGGWMWHRHPGVRTGVALTRGERAADRLRNGMGSWAFVLASIVFLTAWMLTNRSDGFDPYPFILLNLVLSCVAALQGAILLIAARRSDQIAAELAMHDYETNREALDLLHGIHELLTMRASSSEP